METTKHHRTTTRRRTRKWDKPVSRKFYFYLKEQASIASIYCKQIDETKVMAALEEHINGYVYVHPLNEMEKVVIKLLLPLIEKARERSRRAREAAARRRQTIDNENRATQSPVIEKASSELSSTVLSPFPDTSTPSSPTQTDITQRREAAAERRRLKHLKRIARRQQYSHGISTIEKRPHQ